MATIIGTVGDDVLTGTLNDDILDGLEGNDELRGLAGDDTLDGGPGDDLLVGYVGDDILLGDEGNDILRGGEGADELRGGIGDDDISGGGGDDDIFGGEGNDSLFGREGNDVIYGRDGDDLLIGNMGDDTLDGGTGDDILRGGVGNDVLFGGGGVDRMYGGDGEDRLYGRTGDDVISGNRNDDIVIGNRGDDTLDGGFGDDILRGGIGRDELHGGAGDDVLYGGAWADAFVFDAAIDGSDDDVIADFDAARDTVRLLGFGFETKQQLLDAMADSDSGVQLTLPAGGTITFSGLTKADMIAAPESAFDVGQPLLNSDPVPQDAAASAEEDGDDAEGELSAFDADGDSLSFSLNGTVPGLALASDGSWTFDPSVGAYDDIPEGESREVVAEYTVTDGQGGSSTGVLTITVVGANDAPVADPVADAVSEDSSISGTVADDASDVDGDALTYARAPSQLPVPGLTFDADGSYVFDASDAAYQDIAAGDTRDVTFDYVVSDGNGGSDTATLTITVTGTNDAPVASVRPAVDVDEGDPTLSGTLVDSDIDGDALAYTPDAPVAGFSLDPSGDWSFDPSDAAYEDLAVGETRDVVVAYTVSDGNGGSDSGSVTFRVTGTNDAPVAENVTDAVSEDGSIAGTVADDASDVDGDALTYARAPSQLPVPGLTFDANGSYVFDASDAAYQDIAAGETRFVTFDYVVSDGNGGSDPARLTIAVTGTNDAPVASATSAFVDEGDATIFGELDASDIDGDDLTFTPLNSPAGFDLNTSTGIWSFDASNPAYDELAEGDTQNVVVGYTVSDGKGGSDFATLTIQVTGTNDAPVAENVTAAVSEDSSIAGTVANDASDVDDGDVLTFAPAASQLPVAGLTFNSDGGYVFDASDAAYQDLAKDDTRDVTFDYVVSDGNGGSDTARLTITVTGTNDAPVATDVAVSGFEDTTISGSVELAASDVDAGSTLTFSVESGDEPFNGTVTMNADGSFAYEPAPDYSGTDSFTYTVTDDEGATATGVVDIDVVSATYRLTTGPDAIPGNAADEVVIGNEDTLTSGDTFVGNEGDDTVVISIDTGVEVDGSGNPLPAGDGDTLNFAGFAFDVETFQTTIDGNGTAVFDMSSSNITGNTIRNVNSRTDVVYNFVNLHADGPDSNDFINDTRPEANLEIINNTLGARTELDILNQDILLNFPDAEVNILVQDSDDDIDDGGEIVIDNGIQTHDLSTLGTPLNAEIGIDALRGGNTTLNVLTEVRLSIGDTDQAFDATTTTGFSGFENALATTITTIDASGSTGRTEFSAAGDGTAGSLNTNDLTVTLGDGDGNVFQSGSGDDFITGGANEDRIDGGAGEDEILGGAGEDFLLGGADDDLLEGGDNDDELHGNDGHDDLFGDAGEDELFGGAGEDFLSGGADDDLLEGGTNDDILEGDGGVDTLRGDAGDDILRGGADGDILDGGDDSDTVYGDGGNDVITAGTLGEGDHNERVYAGADDDIVTTRGEFLRGSTPGGLFPFSDKRDILDGGPGEDLLNIELQSSYSNPNFPTATDPNALNDVTDFEDIRLLGGDHHYIIANGSAFDLDTTSVFVNGSDAVGGVNGVLSGTDSVLFDASALVRGITIWGGEGDDRLTGGFGNDVLAGDGDTGGSDGGDDILIGNAGNDLFLFDRIELDLGDTVAGGRDDDTIELSGIGRVATIGADVTSIETLEVTDGGDALINIDDGFTNNGGLFAGTPRLHIDGSGMVGQNGALTVDASDQTNDVDLEITGGDDDDTFDMGAWLDSGDKIRGGDNRTDSPGDTLIVDVRNGVSDIDFADVRGIECLKLVNPTGAPGPFNVTLGANAALAGITKIDASALDGPENDGTKITVSGFDRELTIIDGDANLEIDTTGNGDNREIIELAGGDDIVKTGDGDDIVKAGGSDFDYADAVDMGDGYDEVELQNQGGSVDVDVDLDLVLDVEAFTFEGNGFNFSSDNHTINFRNGNVTTVTPILIDGSNVTSGADSLTVTLEDPLDEDFFFTIDGIENGSNTVIKENLGGDNDIVFFGKNGTDSLHIDGGDFGSTIQFDGGAGDEDEVVQTGGLIQDDGYRGVTPDSVERLVGQTRINAELGEFAARSGLDTLIGGAGDDMALFDPAFDGPTLEVYLGAGGDDMVDAGATSSQVTFFGDLSDIDANDNLTAGSNNDGVFEFTANVAGAVGSLVNTDGISLINIREGDGTVGNPGVVFGLTLGSQDIDLEINEIGFEGETMEIFGSNYQGDITYNGEGDSAVSNVTTGSGNDVVSGGSLGDTLVTDGGDDEIYGESGDDVIDSGTGDDYVEGGSGEDEITTGQGEDEIYGGADADQIDSGDDADEIYGEGGDDRIIAGDGDDYAEGGDGNDVIGTGSTFDDFGVRVAGGLGRDTFHGGDDDDLITGGAAADSMSGGDGADAFRYVALDEMRDVGAPINNVDGFDQVHDFDTTEGDEIRVETVLIHKAIEDLRAAFPGNPSIIDNGGVATPNLGNGAGFNYVGSGDKAFIEGLVSLTARDGVADYGIEKNVNGTGSDKLWIDINDDGVLTGLDLQIVLKDGVDATLWSSDEVQMIDTIAPTVAAVDLDIAEVFHDPVTIEGPFDENQPGVVVQGDYASGDTTIEGQMNGSDNDGTAVEYDVTSGGSISYSTVGGVTTATVVGTFGTLTLTLNGANAGAYTYEAGATGPQQDAIEALDDTTGPAHAPLPPVPDQFGITVTDDVGLVTPTTFTVNVTGADDQPVLSPITDGSVTEVFDSTVENTADLSGDLSTLASDADASDTLTYGVNGGSPIGGNQVQVVGSYGTLTLNTVTGVYSYNYDDDAVEAVALGETPTDDFVMYVSDGDDANVTDTFTVTIIGDNDRPIAGDPNDVDTGSALEGDVTNLTDSGSLTVNDPDDTDLVNISVSSVSTNGVGGAIAGELGMLSITSANPTNPNNNGSLQNVGWLWNSGAETYDAIDDGETRTLTYTITYEDRDPANTRAPGDRLTATDTVTITITGTNDGPSIDTVDPLDTDAVALIEDVPNVTSTGTLTVTDPDLSDAVSVAVTPLAQTGTYIANGGPGVPGTAGMFSVSAANLPADPGTVRNLTWTFDPNGEQFDAIAEGETLILSYRITVTDDNGVTASETVDVTITGTNDAPDIRVETADDSAVGAVTEQIGPFVYLTDSDTLTVTDVDDTDTVTAAVTGASVNGASTYSFAPSSVPTPAELQAMMSVTPGPVPADTGDTENLTWVFDSSKGPNPTAFDFLAVGETLVVDYEITVTDDSGEANNTDTQTVTVTITGTNDAPDIFVVAGAGDSAVGSVTEATGPGVFLTDSDTLTVNDVDDTDTVTAAVTGASVNGASTYSFAPSSVPTLAELQAMMSVTPGPVDADSGDTANLTWTFDSSQGAGATGFDFLAEGETLVIDYEITVTDDSGQGDDTDTQTVTVTITGENDRPDIEVLAGNSDSAAVTETNDGADLVSTGSLTVTDIDDSDDVAMSASDVQVSGTYVDNSGVSPFTRISQANLLAMMTFSPNPVAADASGGTSVNWTFDPQGEIGYSSLEAFDFLAKDETLVLEYTVTADDGSGQPDDTDTQTVTITITGTNDAPTLVVNVDDTDADSVSLTASDPDDNDSLNLVSDINSVSAIPNDDGQKTDFTVQEQGGVLTDDLLVEDPHAATGDSGYKLIQGTDNDDTMNPVTDKGIYYGFDGDDTITGGSDNDLIFGGNGDDVVTGGSGADIFVFNTNNFTDEDDRVTDFLGGTDAIDMSKGGPVNSAAQAEYTEVDASGFTAANIKALLGTSSDANALGISDTGPGNDDDNESLIVYFDVGGTDDALVLVDDVDGGIYDRVFELEGVGTAGEIDFSDFIF